MMTPVARITRMLGEDYRALGGSLRSFMNKRPTAFLPAALVVPGWAHGGARRNLVTIKHEECRVFSSVGEKKEVACLLYFKYGSKTVRTLLENSTPPKQDIISTSCPLHNEDIRAKRELATGAVRDISSLLAEDEIIIGSTCLWLRGSYAGGNPTTSLTRSLSEQIYTDPFMFMVGGVSEWKENSRSIKNGPRLSSRDEMLIVYNKITKKYRNVLVSDKAFVNSTISRGIETDHNGHTHPLTLYTPGSALRHQIKANILETADGGTLQTLSTFTNASADILAHWLCNLIESTGSDMPGISKLKCSLGKFKERRVHSNAGELLATIADTFTGTPFSMMTLTIRRDKEGNLTHFMVHNRSKPWPGSEAWIEFYGKSDTVAKGKLECSLYSARIPKADSMRDFTVAKLVTPVMIESTDVYEVTDGELSVMLAHDKVTCEIKKDMMEANQSMRFGVGELIDCGASLGMKMSALGISKEDTRPSVVVAFKNGEINDDEKQRIIESLTHQCPGSMEHISCGGIAKVVTQCLEIALDSDQVSWTTTPGVKELWDIMTSKTPTYEQVEDSLTKYEEVIHTVVKDPKEIKFLNDCRCFAKQAHEKLKEAYVSHALYFKYFDHH